MYRFPTEAEWEYAVRAGTQTAFAQGPDVTRSQVNYSDQEKARSLANGDPNFVYTNSLSPVEKLNAANAWGLRHMSGNIRELTMSCWSVRHELWQTSNEYLVHAQAQGECFLVTRGGSYTEQRNFSRTGSRSSIAADTRISDLGFRILREMPTPNP